jgi:hypothetical protein
MSMRDDMRQKDETAIDWTFAALGRVVPPEGIEARVNQRLRYAAALDKSPSRQLWRPPGAWWFGALTGAAAASLFFCVMVFALHGRGSNAVANNAPAVTKDVRAFPVSQAAEPRVPMPCTAPALRRKPSRAKDAVLMRAAAEREKPIHRPTDELTPQERELVRLTKIAAPKDLSTMSFEARAALDAQQSTAFQKFFTPPPPPPHDEGVNE